MKYKIKQSGKTQKTIEVRISKEIIAREFDRIYLEIFKTATLAGFRKGKAPLPLIKKQYKKEATDEAVRNLVLDSFKKASAEADIKMLGLPEISDMEFDEEKEMTYKATVNISPQVRLKAYKGLNLKKMAKEVKEADVGAAINNLRDMSAKYSTREGAAKTGDYIVGDLDCAVDGLPVEKKENAWLYVGEDSFLSGKDLEGLKVNDVKDVEKALPKDYSKKEAAGKNAKFRITVKEVKERALPELNDEFAVAAGNFKNMTELREAVRENIKKLNAIEEKRDLENQALKLLDKNASFDAPQFMVDRRLERLVDEAKSRLKREQRLSEEQAKSMDKDLRARFNDEAVREVRAFFILAKIAELENITVDDKEADAAILAAAASSGHTADEVRKHYKENDLFENLREDIRQRKVLEFVIKNANIS